MDRFSKDLRELYAREHRISDAIAVNDMTVGQMMDLFKRYLFYVDNKVYDNLNKTWLSADSCSSLIKLIARENQLRLQESFEKIWNMYALQKP